MTSDVQNPNGKIEYPELADQWHVSGCYQAPSALHGWLTGYLAAGARLNHEAWLEEAQDYLEIETCSVELEQMLLALYDDALHSLKDESMAYDLLLPDDEEADLDEQVECLAQWSKGFLDGFGASGKLSGRPDDDVAEVLKDMDAFSQAGMEHSTDPEDLQLYMELVEHARVAALTVFYAFNKSGPSQVPEIVH
ncbi:MAG: UPF0149 family protein [Oleibacter sp.]|nr:UPF0149 family protein [Thalassolituus sp.]